MKKIVIKNMRWALIMTTKEIDDSLIDSVVGDITGFLTQKNIIADVEVKEDV